MENLQSNLFYSLAGVATLASFASCTGKQKPAEQPPLNIVYIMTDDHTAQMMSCYDTRYIETPNLDRIAKDGVRFTNSFVSNSLSGPSRACMLTGKFSHKNGFTDNTTCKFDGTQQTMPKLLQQAGYQTAIVGKWHLGLGNGNVNWNRHISPSPNEIGFDYSYIMAATNDRVPTVYVKNGNVVNLDPNDPIEVSYKHNFPGEPTGKDNPELLKMHPSHGHDQSIVNGISRIGYMKGGKSALWQDEKIAETLTGKAVSFIEGHKSAPFFLYFATQDAHVPRVPSPQFAGKSGMGPRGDCLLEFDWSVGEILNALERLGLDKNTVVIFASDHGETMCSQFTDDPKNSPYSESMNIPFLVRYPGHVQPRVDNLLMSAPDIMPTILGLCGLGDSIPANVQGRNWAPLFFDEKAEIERPGGALYIQNLDGDKDADGKVQTYFPSSRGYKTARYTLAFYIDKKDRKLQKSLLFDDEKDPYQMNNLPLEENKEIVAELCREMGKELKAIDDPWYKERILSDMIPY